MEQLSGTVEEWEVLDLLTSLVDKSLVVYEEDEQGVGRYRLLETVRQYARDRLLQDKQIANVRQRHGDYFLALAEAAEPDLRGPHQKAWCDRLEVEHDNLRSILDRCLDNEIATGTALRLAYALHRFWWIRGYLQEGYGYLQAALARPDAAGRARARALTGAALLAYGTGHAGEARALQTESLQLAQQVGDREIIITSCYRFGLVAFAQADATTARACTERALTLSREANHVVWEASSLAGLGFICQMQGDYEQAHEYFAATLSLARRTGQAEMEALGQIGEGILKFLHGDPSTARALVEEALATLRAGDLRTYQPLALIMLARATAAQGDYDAARPLVDEALVMGRASGQRGDEAIALTTRAWCEVEEGLLPQAQASLRHTLPVLHQLGRKYEVAECLELSAHVAVEQFRWEAAARLYGAAAGLRTALGASSHPSWQRSLDADRSLMHDALGDAAATAWSAGEATTLGQAVEYALNERG